MTPFTKRKLLVFFTSVLFGVLLYAVIKLIPFLSGSVQHLEIIVISIMIMISLVVMFFWASLGVIAGLISFLTALIFLYKPMTALNPYYYGVLILAFFLNSFMGYNISKKIYRSNQQYTVTMEKIQEDINLIKNHVHNRDAEVSAMGLKVESLLKLKNIADSLSVALSTDEVIKIIVDKTYELFAGESRVVLYMLEPASGELNLAYSARSEKREPVPFKKGGIFDRWVLKNMKSLLVRDISRDFRFSVDETGRRDDFTSLISKPLIIEGNALGILRVDDPAESVYEQHELRLLDIIGELGAVALENAKLYRQTEELAIRDSLTGLYVHRYFMERLEEEVKRAYRSDTSLALIMLDIDDFKTFNDEHGHIAGDAVLKNIGRILRAQTSAGDIVARYGGEEFVFLTIDRDREKALRIAQKIRNEIKDTPVTMRREKYTVTVSVGVALFPKDARSRDDLIWEADNRLYEAKTKGKNRVCSG
jgi:diguanylate cyclase (GGDEF)-like protein